jgi:hypothetical protein
MYVGGARDGTMELERSNMIHVGEHVVVRGEDEEAIVTAVHPDSQVEIEYLHASEGGPRRRRYAAEALDVIEAGHDEHRQR